MNGLRCRLWYALDCPPAILSRECAIVTMRRLRWRIRRLVIRPAVYDRWVRRFP